MPQDDGKLTVFESMWRMAAPRGQKMGQFQFSAPILGAVWSSALAILLAASICAAQDPIQGSAQAELPVPIGLDPAEQDVLGMDLEQLSRADVLVPAMDTVVSSVSRQESTVGRSPAAVFVITPEMIRRSGARNIPDLLRMAPGVQVARIDANKWAISIRGFNYRYAGKLLVQIDGRAVYRQGFGGVIWNEQDVLLQDVERIEIIRGPGATVWGANAVNGIINIITKAATETQGALVVVGVGTEERGFSAVRYGGQWGEDVHWRVYGKQFERDGGFIPQGDHDDWRQARAGFRVDMTPTCDDTVTVLGNFFDGYAGTAELEAFPTPPFTRQLTYDTNTFGQSYLARWSHVIDDESDWQWQAYYDRAGQRSITLDDIQETVDVDFQYRFHWREGHNVICGAGYRHADIQLDGNFTFGADPPAISSDLFSYFIQDEITLEEDRWYLMAGSKFEHNEFTGFEVQPSIRLLHLPSDRESVWFAVSRAVRTASPVEQYSHIRAVADPFTPVFVEIRGDTAVEAEDLLAFEVGYRAAPSDDFSWDVAAFYNHYDDLIGIVPGGSPFFDPGLFAVIVPLEFANSLTADTYGGELTATYRVNPKWELSGAYSLLYMDVHAAAGDLTQDSSPNNQLYLRSSWTPRCDWDFDLIGRYVDNLPARGISSYFVMDVRLAWRPTTNFEWSVVGRNLLVGQHAEFTDSDAQVIATEVQSEISTMITWTY